MINYIKKWMQKYRWTIIIVILVTSIPIAINFILLFPSFTSIVGDNTEWLSFWSGYISAAVAFVILHIQRMDSKITRKKINVKMKKTVSYNSIY